MRQNLYLIAVLLVACGWLAGCDDDDPAPKSGNALLASFVYSDPITETQPDIQPGVLSCTNYLTNMVTMVTVTPTAADANATLRIRAVNSTNPAWTNFSAIVSGTSRTYDLPYGGYMRTAPRGQIIEVEVVAQNQAVTNLYEFIVRWQ